MNCRSERSKLIIEVSILKFFILTILQKEKLIGTNSRFPET